MGDNVTFDRARVTQRNGCSFVRASSVALVVIALAWFATGCSHRPPPGLVDEAKQWTGAAHDVLADGNFASHAETLADFRWTKKLRTYDLSGGQRLLAQRNATLRLAITDMRRVGQTSDEIDRGLVDEAAAIQRQAVLRDVTPEFGVDLDKVTTDTVKGLVCDKVGDSLLGDEQERAGVADLPTWDQVLSKWNANAWNELTRTWLADGVRRVMDWTGWFTSVANLADRVVQTQVPGGVISFPNGARTRAFYYYMKACHAPPRVTP